MSIRIIEDVIKSEAQVIDNVAGYSIIYGINQFQQLVQLKQ